MRSAAPILSSFFLSTLPRPPRPPLFPYTTLFRSQLTEATPARGATLAPAATPARRLPRPRHRLSERPRQRRTWRDRKSTRLNSSHVAISYAVFCLKKKKKKRRSHDAE